MAITAGVSQKQHIGMIPQHIQGKAVLKMSLQELQEFVRVELCENPALILDDATTCPVCGSELLLDFCEVCGASTEVQPDACETYSDEWQEDFRLAEGSGDDPMPEPFAGVAGAQCLADHLKEQIRTNLDPRDFPVAELIVDSLDERGYLREPLYELAVQFGLSVPELEAVLLRVQALDPPGIAAKDLRECLLIQLRQLETESAERRNAEALLSDHWECVSRLKIDTLAARMRIDRQAVEAALRFIRNVLNPYPAGAFRDPWQKLAPRRDAKLAPDVIVRRTELGLVAEVVDPISSRIRVDEMYESLYAEMSRKCNGGSEGNREHVRECVSKARALVEALEFRGAAVRKVADELVNCQSDFFEKGAAYLKPISRKQIAEKLGLHESTVCRAMNGKLIQLPTGEAISSDMMFDAALPVKEMVRQLAHQRLSDGEIARKLEESGIHIARRTVAKYRDQLRVLPVEYRLPTSA